MFGKTAIMKMNDGAREPVPTVSTGSLALDQALGTGGIPRGRIAELYGPESSGKSTIALHLAANSQKVGSVVYIDTEHSLEPKYAAALGVNMNDLLISQPETTEQAFEIIEKMVDSGDVSLIVIDSIAAMVPRAELEGDYGDSNVGLQARLMGQAMRKLTGKLSKTNTTLLCINQLRYKVGVIYGSPEVTPGGNALKFYASVRLDVRRTETEKQDGEASGNRTKVKVVKNKLAPPHRVAEFSILYGEGISRERELVDIGTDVGVLTKSGSWYKWGSVNLAQGAEKTRLWLVDNPVEASTIEAEIEQRML
jgi:recombination protein RecA